MDLNTVTGAGGTLEVGGKMLSLRQLKVGDIGQIQTWVLERMPRPFEIVAKALVDLQPLKETDPEAYEEIRKELTIGARQDAKTGKGIDPDQAWNAISGLEGLAYAVWLSCREYHPAETYETIKMALDGEDLDKVKYKLDQINHAWMQDVVGPPAVPTPEVP